MRNIKKNEEAVTPVLAVILLVAITVIVAVIIAVFMFGVGAPADAPQAKLRFTANVDYWTVYHEGGDPLINEQSRVIIKNAISGIELTPTGGQLLSVYLPLDQTLVPGSSFKGLGWNTAPAVNDIIIVQVMDIPTGQMVANVKVVVM